MKINLVLTPELLLLYFEIRPKYAKSEMEHLLLTVVDNPSNIHTFSEKFISLLCPYLSEKGYKEEYQNFFTEMSDSGRIESFENLPDNDVLQLEFEHLIKCSTKTVIGISNSQINCTDDNIINFDNYRVCKKTKLFIELISKRNHTTSFSDFNNENEVIDFLNSIYSFQKSVSNAVIIDRYANCGHHLFDYFKMRNIHIDYYTLSANGTTARAIKSILDNYVIFTTPVTDLIHERAIFIGKVAIIIDDDFNNLGIRETWTMNIKYSSDFVREHTRKCERFNRSLFQ